MKTAFLALVLTAAILFSATSPVVAQQFLPSEDAPSAASASTTVAAAPVQAKALTARWLDLTTFSHAERYRNAFAFGGTHNFDSAQTRSVVAGFLKLDREGRYRVGFNASSGRYFNWSFSSYTGPSFITLVNTPAFRTAYFTPEQFVELPNALFADPAGLAITGEGLRSKGQQFYMRQLYLSATPAKLLTVEFGSFGIEHGLSTEITTFDDDGYLSGERVRLRAPKHLFVDEIGYTNAFFGNIDTVNVFARGSSFQHANYHQLFANKKLNRHVAVSAEYTRQIGTDTLREAALVIPPANKVVDSVRLEVYERLNSHVFPGAAQSPIGPIPSLTVPGASGFAVTVDKNVGRLSGNVGYASVDNDYSVYGGYRFTHIVGFSLNGDSYGQGNRGFAHASVRLSPGVSAFGFYTHEVGAARFLTFNQQGFSAGMAFDLKAIANREKHIF